MSAAKEKAPTRQRQGFGVNHFEAIHMANTTAVQGGAQQLVRVFDGVIGSMPSQVCDGRELHGFLKVGRDFATWMVERIKKYGFEAGLDYAQFATPQIRGAGNRGARTEYHLTLDMAKELSMVENNDQGRMVRRHFIDMERKALSQPALPAPEQSERITHAFRGARVQFLVDGAKVWVKASCITAALGLGGSDRITRSLADDRKVFRLRGQQKHIFIDPAAAYRAAGYVRDAELAKAWEEWLAGVMKTFDKGVQKTAVAEALMPGHSAVERFGLDQLLDTKMLFSLDEQGRAQVKALPVGALIVTPERLADVLRDPFTVPAQYLPGLMHVIAGRMGEVFQHVLLTR
ncbi:antA/AntB antirepressor family protein [Pseudomonas sp.]|uniref:antA/AntB antirepressor family protein n=1 Tax=Pseudomonas sp. TaxID=306 RepID=UPI0027376113|nr:antA/AntB antirepressor family protein [Pseudomonas sp.]MDP2746197.1 antA/AntB antirepressor family protein [Pseudomonas sp.]